MTNRTITLRLLLTAAIGCTMAFAAAAQDSTPAIPLIKPGQDRKSIPAVPMLRPGETGEAPAAPGTPEAILQALTVHETLKPVYDPQRMQDPEFRTVYSYQDSFYVAKRVMLIGNLWRGFPETPQLRELMAYRWENAGRIYGLDIAPEIQAFAKRHPEARETVTMGHYQLALLKMREARSDAANALAAAETFINAYPDDLRGAPLLAQAANLSGDDQKSKLNRRIISDYPESPEAARAVAAIRQSEGRGQSFELTFIDHLTGNAVSMDELRGKVVVIDFWATWCGPCVAEIPHMKELYAQYHEQGVEFIGVSCDRSPEQGGDVALTDYCRDNDMPWPQFYQGGDNEFSREWGVTGIPTLFIIDKEGTLHSTKARGRLDTLIPDLLAK